MVDNHYSEEECVMRGSFKFFPESLYFSERCIKYSHLSYVSFKIVPLCNCAIPPATVKVLETFPGSHFVKNFLALMSHS